MRESVSAILIHEDDVFFIKRQSHLRAFPGYFSFPGGKVDKEDNREHKLSEQYGIEARFLHALSRELDEELNFDLDHKDNQSLIKHISLLGEAITPDFNPHRFRNLYVKVYLNEKPSFSLDAGEIEKASWLKNEEAFEMYNNSKMLVVPPMITILEDLARDINSNKIIDPNLKYDSAKEVPMIRPVHGIRQFLPLSHTFPPANRTNCFLIGDTDYVLVDPSPSDKDELEKLINSIEREVSFKDISKILLSHHHPDHHEFSTDIAKRFNLSMSMTEDTHRRILNKCGDEYFSCIKIDFIKEGDIICKDNGINVIALETPGHDEGQVSLLREDLAWCIVFDLIQTIGTVVVGDDEGDMKKYFDSLRRIIKLNADYIFPSHGIGIGGTHKLKATLKHRLEREQSISLYHNEGLNEDEILQKIYAQISPKLHKYALKTIRAHLNKIQLYGLG